MSAVNVMEEGAEENIADISGISPEESAEDVPEDQEELAELSQALYERDNRKRRDDEDGSGDEKNKDHDNNISSLLGNRKRGDVSTSVQQVGDPSSLGCR